MSCHFVHVLFMSFTPDHEDETFVTFNEFNGIESEAALCPFIAGALFDSRCV